MDRRTEQGRAVEQPCSNLSQAVERVLNLRDQDQPLQVRFWARVDRSNEDGCWLWKGGFRGNREGNDYGYLRVGRKLVLAHRIAYELEHGPIPAGLDALHRCDRPQCVRASHLFLGTQADNNADMVAKGRNVPPRRSHTPVAVGSRRAPTEQSARSVGGAVIAALPTIWSGLESANDGIIRVLRSARALLTRDGWSQRPHEAGHPAEPPSARGWALYEALRPESDSAAAWNALEGARRVIRKIIGTANIPDWHDHPYRTKAEVVGVIDRALVELGGRRPRRGSWTVTHGSGAR